jgi:glycosyltransferase involved in cell wall biosynthesis
MVNYTLITSCLNSIETIEKTVDSVLIQKYLPNQYIFVDGGSTDGTLEFIASKEKEIKSQGINLQLIHQKTKGGIYESWNLCLNQIDKSSDYIFILNSDDWYYKTTIEYVSNFFLNNQNFDIICGASQNFHENNKTNILFNRNLKFFPFLMPIIHPACFIRKRVYDKVGLFNDSYRVSGDYDFLYRAYKLGFNFKFTNKLLVKRIMGGYADSNKKTARTETYRIGYNHSKVKIMPLIAYWIRILLKR